MSQPLKYLTVFWILVVIGFAAYGLYSQPVSVDELLSRFEITTSLMVLGFILFGKIVMVVQVHLALKASGENCGKLFSWQAYSLADVAKYVPGGIWGLVGRIGIYKQANIPVTRGMRILLVETMLIILFSATTGLVVLLLTSSIQTGEVFTSILGLLFLAALFMATFFALRPLGLAAAAFTFVLLGLAWFAFGFSFALVATSGRCCQLEIVGIFNIGFAAGQLALFAPSGIGVREWVVSILSRSELAYDSRLIVELVLAHRLIWMIADFVMLIPLILFPASSRLTQARAVEILEPRHDQMSSKPVEGNDLTDER